MAIILPRVTLSSDFGVYVSHDDEYNLFGGVWTRVNGLIRYNPADSFRYRSAFLFSSYHYATMETAQLNIAQVISSYLNELKAGDPEIVR